MSVSTSFVGSEAGILTAGFGSAPTAVVVGAPLDASDAAESSPHDVIRPSVATASAPNESREMRETIRRRYRRSTWVRYAPGDTPTTLRNWRVNALWS